MTNPYRASSQSRRNTPVTTLTDNLTWAKSHHILAFGGSYTQTKSWQQTVGSSVFSTVTFGISTTDPINNGSTSLFDTDNFPNSSATNRTDAATMYAMLTGRVCSLTRSVTLNEKWQYAAHRLRRPEPHERDGATTSRTPGARGPA